MACKKQTARLSLSIKKDFYNPKFHFLRLKQSRFDFNLVLVYYYYFFCQWPRVSFSKTFQLSTRISFLPQDILLSGCIYWNAWRSFIEFSLIIINFFHHALNENLEKLLKRLVA